MEVFGMVVFLGFIALLVRSLFKKPNGEKLQKFVDNWEWAEPREVQRGFHDLSPHSPLYDYNGTHLKKD